LQRLDLWLGDAPGPLAAPGCFAALREKGEPLRWPITARQSLPLMARAWLAQAADRAVLLVALTRVAPRAPPCCDPDPGSAARSAGFAATASPAAAGLLAAASGA